jgi:co-chaperonin GroES (HSP10)|tara:strand:- start:990 stop:1259 length:270 start_codon:yes stop_codon:yes gene_type:complete
VIKPVNRHILVDYSPPQEKSETGILLPDDYKAPEEKHIVVGVLSVSKDVSFHCKKGDKIVIDKKMLEELSIDHSIYYTILENYVIGVME